MGLRFISKKNNEQEMHELAMSPHHCLDPQQAAVIRQVLDDVENALPAMKWDACDSDDVREVIAKADAELQRDLPNVLTLGTYLNSLARSLRSQPNARTVVLQLDAAMREARVPTNWEH